MVMPEVPLAAECKEAGSCGRGVYRLDKSSFNETDCL
jgi:hypothetical protein